MKRSFKLLFASVLEGYVRRLRQANPELKLVAVGGSVGKTSTKLAIASVLKQKFRVNHHEGNYNDPISVPLSILGLEVPALYNPLAWLATFKAARRVVRTDYNYDVALVELGTDQPGDIPAFMKFLKPDVGVVTATVPEHMLQFKTKQAVIDEEFGLARGSKVAVINGDDEGLKMRQSELKQKVITYGQSGAVHFTLTSISQNHTLSGQLDLGQKVINVETNVVAEHSLYALMAAAAVGQELGLSQTEIASGLADFKPVAGRMNLLNGVNNSLIIDDSYNASPDAVVAALAALAKIATGRKIAVLGSMNELGDYAREGHELVGAACGQLDLLITIGRQAQDILVPAAVKAGLKAGQIKSFMSPYAAGKYLKPLIQPGDTILVKGSQNGVFSEEAAAQVLRNLADRSKLVRQTAQWQATKKEQFEDYDSAK
ncbi:MAG TPA: UDP-N-acetylmuramoyl-tripeptide--D-alanyl-D-alanine ligase [Candidatus Saccharimonadales bacterium]|nr:UDP-N-acetylmuramoyl-tripeptide--D-alanyl-D-alanine ligase [Candidatus Saccharimonadales bacterium]